LRAGPGRGTAGDPARGEGLVRVRVHGRRDRLARRGGGVHVPPEAVHPDRLAKKVREVLDKA